MSPKTKKTSRRSEYLVLLLSLVTACGDIGKFGQHSTEGKSIPFSSAEDSSTSENSADSSAGSIVETPYTAVTDTGEGQVLTFEGSLVTPGETSKGSEDGTCQGAGCSTTGTAGSSTGASPNPPGGSECEDDQCTTRPNNGGNSGPGGNVGTGTSGSEHMDPNLPAGNMPAPHPDRQVPVATDRFYKDKLNVLIDKIVTQGMNTLGTGRSARAKAKPVEQGKISLPSYPFQTPQDSANGQRLAKARLYRNAVKNSIPADDARRTQRHQLVDAADRSLEKADKSFGTDLSAAEFALRFANLALNTAASAKIESWGKDIYRSVTGTDPTTNKALSSTMRGASLVATVAVIDLEVISLTSLAVPIGIGVGIVGAIILANELSGNIADAIHHANGVEAAAGRFGLAGVTAVERFTENLASPSRTEHILFGDKGGGGHMYPGKPGKSIFPQSWGPEKIMEEVSDVVSDPASEKVSDRPRHGKERFKVIGTRDGVKIVVSFEPDGEGIISAYPESGPGVTRNPR